MVKPGRVLFEIGGVDEAAAREALRLASNKLPIKTEDHQARRADTGEGGEAE